MLKNPKIKKVSAVKRESAADALKSEEARATNIQDRYQPVSFDPFRLYLDEIKCYPFLSREDERDLEIRQDRKGKRFFRWHP